MKNSDNNQNTKNQNTLYSSKFVNDSQRDSLDNTNNNNIQQNHNNYFTDNLKASDKSHTNLNYNNDFTSSKQENKQDYQEYVNSKIQEFKENSNFDKYLNIFLINFLRYQKYKSENNFSVFEKKNDTISSENFHYKSEEEVQLLQNDDIKRMKNFFITHEYKKVPSTFNMNYFIDQVKFYIENHHIAMANFHGISMTDSESHFNPTVLTERPVKGPLSSIFGYESVTAEQKYCMICGILGAVDYIHENGFVHSNLNPSTIYIDENLQAKVCDYAFLPPLEVEEKTNKNASKNLYEFRSLSKRPDLNEFYKNGLYAAPEILNGNEDFIDGKSDTYSIGLIIFFILFEKDPTISNGLIEYPSEISDKWKELINECANQNTSLRPKINSILNILLDDKNKLEFISSITPQSQEISITNKTKFYLKSLIKKDTVIDICKHCAEFSSLIDAQTLTIIKAAEKGDIECLEIIGSFFLNGENCLHQNEEMAYRIFKVAADLGSVKSLIKLAEMNENGIGIYQNFKNAKFYYQKAYKRMIKTDPELLRIESKIKETDEKSRMTRIEYLSNQITTENIKSLLNLKCQYEINQVQPNGNLFELKFNNRKEKLRSEKVIKRKNIIKILPLVDKKIGIFDSPITSLPKINISDYYPGENNTKYIRINEELYSVTYLVYDKKTQIPYAAKVFRMSPNEAANRMIQQENIILSKLNHPSFVKYIGYSEFNIALSKDHNCLMPTLLMNFIPFYSLDEMISSPTKDWNSTAKLKVIIGIASGIAELHSHGIIHKKIDLERIMLDENYEPIFTDIIYSVEYCDYMLTQPKKNLPIYIAPEFYMQDPFIYRYELDSYAFGVILYQILTGKEKNEVYPNDCLLRDFDDFLMNNYHPDLPDNMNPIFIDIINSCWNTAIDERLDVSTIYKILADAIKRGEKLIDDDVDIESVKDYIRRLENKEQTSYKYDIHKLNSQIRKKNELTIFELRKIKSLYNVKEIDLREYKLIRDIGGGGFSRVFLIENIKTKQKYAAKQYFMNSKNKISNFIRELEIHSELKHPLILKLIGYSLVDFYQEPSMIIIMEYASNGTLERILKEERHKVVVDEWNETMKLIFIYGIASAISYMHNKNILDLDIKSSNVLVDDIFFPKICDFSISIKTIYNQLNKIEFAGTIPFIAPEVCDKSNRTFKSDVYSFGVLLYIIKYKNVPFKNIGMLEYWCRVMDKNERPILDDSVPKVYRDLIQSCWDSDPNKRPIFDLIVNELETNKEFITNDVDENLFKDFINAVKSEIDKKELLKKFPRKKLNQLYILKKDEMIIDPDISNSLFFYLDESLNEEFEDMEEISTIENDSESTTLEYQSKKTGRKFTVTISNIPIESISKAKKEAEQLFKLNHPTIERFFGFNSKSPKNQMNPMFISEYYPFKTLKEIISNERQNKHDKEWTNTKKLINIYGIAVGMKYLHEHGILHPTLNPKNIHVDSNYRPKLSGIGFYTQPQNSQILSRFTSVGIDEKYFYFSPELLKGRKYCTEKSDVYSYALVVYEILTNENPYKQNFKNLDANDDDAFDFISKKEQGIYQPIFDIKVPAFYQDLIQKCISKNPEERPSFASIVEKLENDLPFIQDNIDENEFNDYKKFIQNYKVL